VLEDRLKDPESKGWLALGRMTLADLANFSWVAAGKIIGERLVLHYDGAMHSGVLLFTVTASKALRHS
jgi:glutathione S-transferase